MMVGTGNISFIVAFGGGVLSFLSPCVLPLVPVYLANVAGASVLSSDGKAAYRGPLFHALVFVAGFSLVFTGMGTAAGLAGFATGAHLQTLNLISGSLLVFFGLFLLASFKIPWLNYEKRVGSSLGSGTGYLRSFLIGAAFSLGWTPCVGPILGGILAMAYNSETAWRGAYLLIAYSLGLGLPFVIVSLAVGTISLWLKRFSRYTPLVSTISGLLLIAVGVLTILNKLQWLSP
ncbi:MAG: cytochrome c biogenesis CcdA family protein [Dehalococcoidia bacterium]